MFVSDHDDTEPVFLNVFQVILLDIIATAGIFVTLKTAGSSWAVSILAAWMGGCLATLAIIGATYWILTQQSRRRDTLARAARRDLRNPPALVPSNIDDPLQLWEADRLMERDHFQQGADPARAEGTGPAATGRLSGAGASETDGATDGRATPGSGRRRAGTDGKGIERRASGK